MLFWLLPILRLAGSELLGQLAVATVHEVAKRAGDRFDAVHDVADALGVALPGDLPPRAYPKVSRVGESTESP